MPSFCINVMRTANGFTELLIPHLKPSLLLGSGYPQGPHEVIAPQCYSGGGWSFNAHHQRHAGLPPLWPAHSAPPSCLRDLTAAPGIHPLVMRGIFVAGSALYSPERFIAENKPAIMSFLEFYQVCQ